MSVGNPLLPGKAVRGRPFQPGNPGRPKGARHKTTVLMEQLLDDEAETLTRAAIDLALKGDVTALRMCLDRLLPVRKDRPVPFTLPTMTTSADAVAAGAAIVAAVAEGELTPSEAAELTKVVEGFTRVLETHDLAERLARLEENRP